MLHIAFGQTAKPATDYLKLPGPLQFNNASYRLSWSAHPTANYYKQEYITAGDDPERFKTMLLIDVVTGNAEVKDFVASKIEELKKLKETNPVVNYETFENKGEYMIDFLLSQNTPDGKDISIIERNVYRYKSVVDKAGQKAVLLFGVSTRAYGAGVTPFLTNLKGKRSDLTNKVAQYTIPQITISK